MSDRRVLGLAALVGLLLGGATSYLQTVLPYAAAPLANSAGSWCLVAFLLALPARRQGVGALASPLALVGLVAGYYVTADLRGFAVGSSSVVFWVIAAAVVGPVLGASAYLLRHGRGPARLVAALPLPGLLVLEALYGLTVNRSSISAAYWITQLVLGLVLMTLFSIRSLRAITRNTRNT